MKYVLHGYLNTFGGQMREREFDTIEKAIRQATEWLYCGWYENIKITNENGKEIKW